MIRVRPRRILLASAFASALAAAAPTFADPQPVPPPPAPGPQPSPYPDGPESPPPPPCDHTICLPRPAATEAAAEQAPQPVPPRKRHIGQVKYEDMTQSGTVSGAATMDSAQIQAVDLSIGDGAGTVYSADPMEGGQIAHYRPGRQKPGKMTTVTPQMQDGTTVYSADPMEGGQIARSKAAAPQMQDTTVYSADPMEGGQVTARTAEPGKLEVPNLNPVTTEPVAKKTATFKTLVGACATGVHIKEAIITTRSGSVTLHDATVTSVTPADPVDGQAMEQVTISYASADE